MNPHAVPAYGLWTMVLGGGLILAGSALLVSARRTVHAARQRGVLAVSGPYSFVRHPQYFALLVIMLGFLLLWPFLPILLMFPLLTWSYLRLARDEERRMTKEFGSAWECYAHGRPAFLPHLSRVCTALASLRKKPHARIGRQRFTAGASAPATRGRTS